MLFKSATLNFTKSFATYSEVRKIMKTIVYYNNPTRCSCALSIIFHCSVTLHVSGAFHTHHQEHINCIYSLRYRSYIGRKVAVPMYDLYRRLYIQLMYSWWWVWKAPETCRVTLQWNIIDSAQLHLVGLL